ncbi:hypothetical protein V496_09849 [Pseudogymnoascus sp. VKM F-4515 (FW-2607)]|nr:hypothetical protein V496_09849 [Pseudogymnoascus sp. VKM F-4515 (FW-2607)]
MNRNPAKHGYQISLGNLTPSTLNPYFDRRPRRREPRATHQPAAEQNRRRSEELRAQIAAIARRDESYRCVHQPCSDPSPLASPERRGRAIARRHRASRRLRPGVRDVVCENASWDADTVKEEDKVDRLGLLEADVVARKRRQVEEREVEAPEGEEHANTVESAERAHGPGEPDFGEQVLDHGGEDETANGATGGGDADRERLLFREVGGDKGDAGREDAAVAEADADALQEAADKDDLFEVAGIGEAAAEGADEEEEEDLETTDPGNVGRWAVEEADVEGLEHAEGIDEAPSCRDRHTCHGALKPCVESSIRRRAYANSRGSSR